MSFCKIFLLTKRKALFKISIVLFFLAQNVSAQNVGSVAGVVKDEITAAPIDFVAVSIYKEGSEIAVKNFMTDIEGRFVFKNLSFGTYKIKLSFIGYKTKLIESITINKEFLNTYLSDIKLSNSDENTLQEVVIFDDKPVIEFGADTIIFNVDQSIQAEGNTAVDLLKSVPMVTVDIDGNTAIAGKDNTRIFIDGKPSDFTAESMTDLLNILPSEAIQKIEVITNPEVKYSADGDGIINIVLKKGYQIGLNGRLSFKAGTLGDVNTNLYTAYGKGKLSITNSLGFKDSRKSTSISTLRSNFKEEEVSSFMDQYVDGLIDNRSYNLRSALNWDITPQQNFRFSARYNNSHSTGDSHLDDHRLNASFIEQNLRIQDTDNGNNSANITLSADYKFKINKKNEKLSAGVTWFNNSRYKDLELSRLTHYPNGNTTNALGKQNQNDISNNRLQLDLDYIKPLTKLTSITLGTVIRIANNGNNQSAYGYDFQNMVDTIISPLTNNFEYQERVYDFYGSYKLRTKNKWTFRGGVRGEFTKVSFGETVIGDNPVPYHNIFPNISINKNYKKKYNFGLSYSMRIRRPRENTLNPSINDSNQSNVSFGNPHLKPSYTNQFQFSFGTYGAKWSLTPRVSYATTAQMIERYRFVPDSLTYQNLGSNKALTFSLLGNYKPLKALTLNGGYTLSRRDYQSKSEFKLGITGFSHLVKLSLVGKLPHKITYEVQGSYYSNTTAQGKKKGSIANSFSLRKTILKNKVMFRFTASDPFGEQHINEFIEALTSNGAFYNQVRNRTINSRNYSLTLSYSFTNARKRLNKHLKD